MAFGRAHASDVLGKVHADAVISRGHRIELRPISFFSGPKAPNAHGCQQEGCFRGLMFVRRNHSTVAISIAWSTTASAIRRVDIFPADAPGAAIHASSAAIGTTHSVRSARTARAAHSTVVDGHVDAAHLWVARIRRAHIAVQTQFRFSCTSTVSANIVQRANISIVAASAIGLIRAAQHGITGIVRAAISVGACNGGAASAHAAHAGFSRGASISVFARGAVRHAGIAARVTDDKRRTRHFNGRGSRNVLVMHP